MTFSEFNFAFRTSLHICYYLKLHAHRFRNAMCWKLVRSYSRSIYIYIYIYTFTCIYIFINVHRYTCTHILICAYVYKHMYTNICIYIYIYIYMHSTTYIYIYTYIYIRTHQHLHILHIFNYYRRGLSRWHSASGKYSSSSWFLTA